VRLDGWRRPGQRRDRSAQGRIRRQHPVIAMPMQSRRWDEGGEPVDELDGSERQVRAPIRAGLREVVDHSLSAGRLQALQGERGPGTIPNQALQPVSVALGGQLLMENVGRNRFAVETNSMTSEAWYGGG